MVPIDSARKKWLKWPSIMMRYFCALVPISGLCYFLRFFPQIFLWRDASSSRWYFFQSRQCGRYLPLQTPRCRAWGLSGERSEVQGWKIASQLLVSINGWFSEVRVDFVDTELLSPTEGDCLDQYLVVRSHGHWSFIKQAAKPFLNQILKKTSFIELSVNTLFMNQILKNLVHHIFSGSTWSTGFNRLCGINPDQHFYVREYIIQHSDVVLSIVL